MTVTRNDEMRRVGASVMYGQTFLQIKTYSTADLDRDEFLLACSAAASEQWSNGRSDDDARDRA